MEFALHGNDTQPHGGIVAPHAVHAFHVSVFAFQVDKHALIGQIPGVVFRRSHIIQDTDRLIFSADHAFFFIGFQFQDLACVQVAEGVIRVRGHGKTFRRGKRKNVACVNGTDAQ